MKLPSIFGAALAGGSHIVSTASSLAILVGAIYLVDCRVSARGTDAIDRCYLSALPMMGLGAGTAGGFMAGYRTYNPALRPPDEPTGSGSDRDEHGRFKRRSTGG